MTQHRVSAILAEISNSSEGGMRTLSVYAAELVIAFYSTASATVIHVPGDYPTIQGGINAASHGDTVLVQPGLYAEHIILESEGITVASTFICTGDYSEIQSTIIDGEGSGYIVSFGADWEYFSDKIIGFTIQNGQIGIDCFHNTEPLISFNVITGNTEHGIWTEMSHATIIHNVITGNSGYTGGGIHLNLYTESEIYNNLITGNSAVSGGGIYDASGEIGIFDNNTIFGNEASQGGGICISYGSPTLTNTILWANEGGDIYAADGLPDVRYCDIEDGWGGEGNIFFDPLFRDAESGDFHLMSTECGDRYDSPCIDAGDPSTFDSILGCDWGLGTDAADIGAYGGSHIDLPTDVDHNDGSNMPTVFQLFQNYPNPFNARTMIQYSLPRSSEVSISVYDILGRRISTIFEGLQNSGGHTTLWNPDDLPSGIYLARLQAGSHSTTVKMVLVR